MNDHMCLENHEDYFTMRTDRVKEGNRSKGYKCSVLPISNVLFDEAHGFSAYKLLVVNPHLIIFVPKFWNLKCHYVKVLMLDIASHYSLNATGHCILLKDYL